ncbi:MAG: DEAD/DEAH box helicase [Cytophagaceae bacterium]|nr:DEAD/DEAH box helicase [Cytophagaceae bacterium]
MTFADFNFQEDLLLSLADMGFQEPSPIQEQAIPIIQSGRDLVACAQTGTGKTAAFMLPLLDIITRNDIDGLKVLVIVPTRELAIQIDQQIQGFSYHLSVSSTAIYGGGDGVSWDQQRHSLIKGVDIIVATPGRLMAQLQSGVVSLKTVKHIVLDEADRMLDMGFYDDIIKILKHLPTVRQTIMFSATMPPKMRHLAKQLMFDPAEVNISISQPASGIHQLAYLVFKENKNKLVQHLLSKDTYNRIIIFTSTKEEVKKLERDLSRLGLELKGFHSDLDQEEREAIMRSFRNNQLQLLIGTDILSRGIDIEGIDLVINMEVPGDPENYIHRIGRTARASTEGTAITFISDDDQYKFFKIESLIGREVNKLLTPSEIGESPLYQPERKKKKVFHRKRRQ